MKGSALLHRTNATCSHGASGSKALPLTGRLIIGKPQGVSWPLPTIPHRPDRRPGPARAETAPIVTSSVKSRIAEIVAPAVVPVVWRIAWSAADCPLRTINWNVVVGRLMIAGQKAIAMPVIDVPRVNGRGERNGWQQRQKYRICYGVCMRHGATYTTCYSNATSR